jgi:peptidoglycan hydrolase-like protein with peptidoglycan-binding domain
VSKLWKLLLAGLAFALLLEACGSADGTSSNPTTTIPAPAMPEVASPTAAVESITSSLQLDLQKLGYRPGTFSGTFNAATQKALIAFQVDEGVTPSEHGAIGPATSVALQGKLGTSSPVVQALQSALTDVGLFSGAIDGRFDQGTLNAVKRLQTRTETPVDGLYGPKTATAFLAFYGKDAHEPGMMPPPTVRNDSGTLLKLGSSGPPVVKLQQRLTSLGYRPGAADGTFGNATASAVLAFQKREGLSRDGEAGSSVMARLANPSGGGPLRDSPGPAIEVDIARQIAFIVLPGATVTTLNVSTGNGATYVVPGGGADVAYTPVGSFTVLRKISGDEVAPLGTLHNPMYFYKGWAIHGAASVPAYPASHGCVRISNADADWLFPLIAVGTPVTLYDTTGKSPGPDGLPVHAAPGY